MVDKITPEQMIERIRVAKKIEDLDFYREGEAGGVIDLYDATIPLIADFEHPERSAPWQLEADSPHHEVRAAFAAKLMELCAGGGEACVKARGELAHSFARFSEYAFDPISPFESDETPINADRVRMAIHYLREAHRLAPEDGYAAMLLATACRAIAIRTVRAGVAPSAAEKKAFLMEGRKSLRDLQSSRRTSGERPDCGVEDQLAKILSALIALPGISAAERATFTRERAACLKVLEISDDASAQQCDRTIPTSRGY